MRSKWVKVTLQALLFIGVPTWIDTWLIPMIPVQKLHLSHFWLALTYRPINTLIWVVAIWLLMPKVLKRFSFRISRDRLLTSAGFGFVYIGGSLFSAQYGGHAWWMIVGGLVFAMSIGLVEETFSRGLIYGFFEQYGVWVAAIISSVHFGLLHFTNFLWGGYSLQYVLAQMLAAASFGFFACGLMIYSGSIWVPIFFHGLTDFPMQLMTQAAFTKSTTGGGDWIGALVEVVICTLFGFSLIYKSQQRDSRRLREIGLRFGLVEV